MNATPFDAHWRDKESGTGQHPNTSGHRLTRLQTTLEKLEWFELLNLLAKEAQTEEGVMRVQSLLPTLSREDVERRWFLVNPLRLLATQGFKAPIGGLIPMAGIYRAAELGQILDGSSLRAVYEVLDATKRVYAFAADQGPRCSTLARVRGLILPLPHLMEAIGKAVGPDGELRDDASPELTRIRRLKVSVRQRIEESITKLLHDGELVKYLQDDFWTVRSERYVVPMRLDGRGRVKGTVLDTSDSGQTLFIEPAAIAPINDQLLELDLEEKLEIARIFRTLSEMVRSDLSTLEGNYIQLIELDVLTAEAMLAVKIEAGPVKLSGEPGLDLIDARHPLLRRAAGDKPPVGNSVRLEPGQYGLIISGPNAGGKTVVLKTVGLLHMMAKAGLLLPADPQSQVYLYDNIWLEMGDAQNLSANLSTFSGHLYGLKPILEQAGPSDLTLLDELAVGTDPQTGAAIGTAIVERLVDKGAITLVSTHFDALKGLALRDRRFRNGSMEFSLSNLKPTYRLILDVPGQSFGLEVAEQIGLPKSVLDRAKELRHGQTSQLDQAVHELMQARDAARAAEATLAQERLAAQGEKTRWENEVELLREERRKVSRELTQRYESRLSDMKAEFDEIVKKLRQSLRDAQKQDNTQTFRDSVLEGRQAAEKSLRSMDQLVSELGQSYDIDKKLPGQPATQSVLAAGTPVFVLPLKKAGTVIKTGDDNTVEVKVGVIKLRVSSHDLRLLSAGEAAGGDTGKKSAKTVLNKNPRESGSGLRSRPALGSDGTSAQDSTKEIGLTLQTTLNTLDLRGKDLDTALDGLWNFLDRALMRGEEALVIIHGHGEGTLKAGVRAALRDKCPYDIRFRPGVDQEGGDGVTIVQLKI